MSNFANVTISRAIQMFDLEKVPAADSSDGNQCCKCRKTIFQHFSSFILCHFGICICANQCYKYSNLLGNQMSQNIVLLLFHFHSVGLTLLRASFDQHCNFFHKVQVQPQSPIISSIGDLLVCFLLPVLLKIFDTKSNCRAQLAPP